MKRLLLPILLLFFALFLIYPVGFLLQGAFLVSDGTTTRFGLDYFSLIFQNPFYRLCFMNSLWIAVASTAACLVLTVPLAHAFLRYRFPGKALLSGAMLLPLILPPFVAPSASNNACPASAASTSCSCNSGWSMRKIPPDWFGAGGFYGIILLEVLHLYPIMFLSVQAALANIDPTLRQAAQNLGAQGGHIFRTVTLPLAVPGIFAGSTLVFVSAFTDLGVPLMFDFQATVPTQIFNLVTQADNPLGYALVVLTLVLVAVLFLLGKRFGEGQYAMLSRSATHDDSLKLPAPAGWALSLLVAGGIAFSLLPHFGVILQSFSARWFFTVLPSEWSAAYYAEVFSIDLTVASMRNSLTYAVSSAGVDLLLGFGIAYLLAREKIPRPRPARRSGHGSPWPCPVWFWPSPTSSPSAAPPCPNPGAAWAASFNSTFLALFDPRKNPTLLFGHRLPPSTGCPTRPRRLRRIPANLRQPRGSLRQPRRHAPAHDVEISLPLISANLIAGTHPHLLLRHARCLQRHDPRPGKPLLPRHQSHLHPHGPHHPHRSRHRLRHGRPRHGPARPLPPRRLPPPRPENGPAVQSVNHYYIFIFFINL
ncbi:MAG: iron ABC transporter permease [Bdellovibrionaceae bacterium]|nr:iron ABC transporter permease [Pseudobdellovibrionaceae bacterium]